ncbi:N-acetylmuramoyl-L-alanine amidase [Bacillus benzoevorans]|uniref:N-acetylmuramoyl-L-alanine amidase n=1 Tax=Bacillus benzoevorans TaxID=1456 RepID=A0A7X0HTB0_9BACI|nr:N-acetylmuramoyl-L-alanine amidase [Bacillus benzoevorans]MBB6446438.1 N-acetylmuramoyl-L-alanine amidase [Bacillus benzoevorans]
MAAREIELHPGHWYNIGSGANGILNEVTEARKVTKRVYEILQSSGVPSTYFEDNTSSNQNQNLGTLVKHHNADRDGLIVSIHFNASGGTQNKAIGTEVLYYDQRDLAEKISKAISDATGGGLLNRGAKQNKGLAVMAQTYEPAVLIEICFVNSTVDAAIYRRDFEKICQAIAKELASYINIMIEPKQVNAAQAEPEREPQKGEDVMAVAMVDLIGENKLDELAKIYTEARVEGILSSTDWEIFAHNRSLTIGQAIYLATVLDHRRYKNLQALLNQSNE